MTAAAKSKAVFMAKGTISNFNIYNMGSNEIFYISFWDLGYENTGYGLWIR